MSRKSMLSWLGMMSFGAIAMSVLMYGSHSIQDCRSIPLRVFIPFLTGGFASLGLFEMIIALSGRDSIRQS
jgi:hypothetical protein